MAEFLLTVLCRYKDDIEKRIEELGKDVFGLSLMLYVTAAAKITWAIPLESVTTTRKQHTTKYRWAYETSFNLIFRLTVKEIGLRDQVRRYHSA